MSDFWSPTLQLCIGVQRFSFGRIGVQRFSFGRFLESNALALGVLESNALALSVFFYRQKNCNYSVLKRFRGFSFFEKKTKTSNSNTHKAEALDSIHISRLLQKNFLKQIKGLTGLKKNYELIFSLND